MGTGTFYEAKEKTDRTPAIAWTMRAGADDVTTQRPMTTADAREVDAGALQDLAEGRGKCVDLADFSLALFRLGDEVFALENACPHRGGPLCEGDVAEGVVYCPLHAWGFDLRSGRAVNVRWEGARTFPARVESGRILVTLPVGEAARGPSDPWS